MSDTEDKITIKTMCKYLDNGGRRYIDGYSLQAVMAEIYRQAHEIGWETKALDSLHDKLLGLMDEKVNPVVKSRLP